MNSLQSLRELIAQLPERLAALPPDRVEHAASGHWSAKQELGHLVDSASNNHQRIVRAQLQDNPAMPDYDGPQWVELHRYQQHNWKTLIALWKALNEHLLAAAEAATDGAWSRTLTIGGAAPVTLQFVFDDYIEHMLEHLRHMGVEVEDLAPANAAAR